MGVPSKYWLWLQILFLLVILSTVSGCFEPEEEQTAKEMENNQSNIEPLWDKSAYVNRAFSTIIEQLKNGDNILPKRNLEEGTFTFLKDPNNKPFYDTPEYAEQPVYGEVVTFYDECRNPYLLWPLAQDYKTLTHLNIFLIGGYADFPQYARTLKLGGNVSAEAEIKNIIFDENGQFSGIEIEEVHYGVDGKPIFRCTSQFDRNMVKIRELNIMGKKFEEYYFIWPTRGS